MVDLFWFRAASLPVVLVISELMGSRMMKSTDMFKFNKLFLLESICLGVILFFCTLMFEAKKAIDWQDHLGREINKR